MALKQMSVSPADYVALDVETNGLKSKEDDLLSISIYKPDDGKTFDRFLPLDLNSSIPLNITAINGIRKRDLKGLEPLSQTEVDKLFEDFELDRRTILHYGALDERFIRDYFQRNGLLGYTRMRFFNFKHLISATRFSDGSLTKDNLCKMFGIEGVTDVHSGMNDCMLEWKLFEAIGGRNLIARMRAFGKWEIDVLSPDYVVPISYLTTYSNLSKLYPRPHICSDSLEIYNLTVSGEDIKRFYSNFSGTTLEELIDVMLDAAKPSAEEQRFMCENYAKNERLGYANHNTEFVPLAFTQEGTVVARSNKEKHKQMAKELNETLIATRKKIAPLVEFIRSKVFNGKPVRSQELSINEDLGILALSDLSTDDAVMEIKTTYRDVEISEFAEQIYYEARGRRSYLLAISWAYETVEFKVSEVFTWPGEKPNKRRGKGRDTVTAALEVQNCELVEYFSSTNPIRVRCRGCGCEWDETYARIKGGRVACPKCHPKQPRKHRVKQHVRMSPEESLRRRAERYARKVDAFSDGLVVVDTETYAGSKEKVTVRCTACGHTWMPRADHLLTRCYCPTCHGR